MALALRLGIFAMSEANTPGVGEVLRAHGFSSMPEAHCYLMHDHARIDLTHPGTTGTCALTFEDELSIAPEDIGERKVSLHRAKLARWAEARGRTFEEAWRAREACIAALGMGA
jgi:hypothetical protein